jgi:predicted transposase YbfD/YdcC
MMTQAITEIPRAFEQLSDPRRFNRSHKLPEMLTIALFAVICGADGWEDVSRYGRSKEEWLKTFLELLHGIPSPDTFGRLFARLKPEAMEQLFQHWMSSMVELSGGGLVAIDGKSLRRSYSNGWDKVGMCHMVSAFVAANQMVFAQISTEGKGMELSAIEKLLDILDLEGAVVSIDALGCQKHIAGKIVQAKADYVLQVKENQPALHAKIKVTMDDAVLDKFEGLNSDYYEEVDGDHGRIETRRTWVCWNVELLGQELLSQWPGLKCMILTERTRQMKGPDNAPPSVERCYHMASLDRRSKAKRLAGCVRGHWGIENKLHWPLDVSFREDERRIRKGHAAENYSRMCRLTLNLLKNEKTEKGGIVAKRKKCGWDDDYLLKVVMG